jgi:cell division septal protein FtsQ
MRSGSSGSRRRGLVSPHGTAGSLDDLGGRTRLVARQRIRRSRARRRALARLVQGAKWLGGLTAAAALLSGAMAWLLTSPQLAVHTIQVEGAARVPAEDILAAAEIPLGINILRLDPAAVRARLEALPHIRRAEIVRELPNRVTILVEERRPFTLVHAGRLHWLDEEARLLGEEREAVAAPAPIISGLSEEELRSMRSAPGPRVQAAMALVRALLRSGPALAAEISEIDMSRREGPVLYTLEGIEVRLGTEQWDERLARLEGVLTKLAAQSGSAVTAVDLRFRDQVVLQNGGRR